MAITDNEIRQGREAKERYDELQKAEAWAEYILARKQQYFSQRRRSIGDTEYMLHRMDYERLWVMEWHCLETKLCNGSGMLTMFKRQLGENVKITVSIPKPLHDAMPEYVGTKLPTIEELEEEYGVSVTEVDDSEE